MKRTKILAVLAVLCALGGALLVQGDLSAATLTSGVNVSINGTLLDASTLTNNQAQVSKTWQFALASGVAAGQADKIYTLKEEAILTGATLSIDVKAALVDAFGAAFTPAKLKMVYIYSCGGAPTCSHAANTTNLTLFGDANSVPILNTAATTTTLTPGGMFLMTNSSAAGIAVTAGTGDIIKIVNAAGATAYVDVVLVGTSS